MADLAAGDAAGRLALLAPAARGGSSADVKPSLPASLRRASAWLTGRTSPERPISPKITVSAAPDTG